MSVNETNPEIRARLRELLEKSREYNRELVRIAREIADLRARAGGASGLDPAAVVPDQFVFDATHRG